MIKRIKGFVNQTFKKVRIVEKPDEELETLYTKRRILRSKNNFQSQIELETVEKELSDKYADKMYNKIKKVLKGAEDSEEGGFHTGHLWKLKKELAPR